MAKDKLEEKTKEEPTCRDTDRYDLEGYCGYVDQVRNKDWKNFKCPYLDRSKTFGANLVGCNFPKSKD